MLYQEKKFELPLEHDVIVTGRMDQVNRIEGNKVEIIDYKTGKPKDEKAAAKICSSASTRWRREKCSISIRRASCFTT